MKYTNENERIFHENLLKIAGFAEGKYVDYNGLSTRTVDPKCTNNFPNRKKDLETLYKDWASFLKDASAEIKTTQGVTKKLQSESKNLFDTAKDAVDKYASFCNTAGDPCLDNGGNNQYNILTTNLNNIGTTLVDPTESLLKELDKALSGTGDTNRDLELMQAMILGTAEDVKESLTSYYKHCCEGIIPSSWWSSWLPSNFLTAKEQAQSCQTLDNKLTSLKNKMSGFANEMKSISIDKQDIYIHYEINQSPNILNIISMNTENLNKRTKELSDIYTPAITSIHDPISSIEKAADIKLWGDIDKSLKKIQDDSSNVLKKVVTFNKTLTDYKQSLSDIDKSSESAKASFSSLSNEIFNLCVPLLFQKDSSPQKCTALKTASQNFATSLDGYKKSFSELIIHVDTSIKKNDQIATTLSSIRENACTLNGTDTCPPQESRSIIGGIFTIGAVIAALADVGIYYNASYVNSAISSLGFLYNATIAFTNTNINAPQISQGQQGLSLLDLVQKCKSNTGECDSAKDNIKKLQDLITENDNQIKALQKADTDFDFQNKITALEPLSENLQTNINDLKDALAKMKEGGVTQGNSKSDIEYALNRYYEYFYITIAAWAQKYKDCTLYQQYDTAPKAKNQFEQILKSLSPTQTINNEDDIKAITNEVIDYIIESIVSKLIGNCDKLLVSKTYTYPIQYNIFNFGDVEASRLAYLQDHVSKTYQAIYFSRISPVCKNVDTDADNCMIQIVDTVYKSSDSYATNFANKYICTNPAIDWSLQSITTDTIIDCIAP